MIDTAVPLYGHSRPVVSILKKPCFQSVLLERCSTRIALQSPYTGPGVVLENGGPGVLPPRDPDLPLPEKRLGLDL